jgi:hypothetical protein
MIPSDLGQRRLLALANVGRKISDAAFSRRLVRGHHEQVDLEDKGVYVSKSYLIRASF